MWYPSQHSWSSYSQYHCGPYTLPILEVYCYPIDTICDNYVVVTQAGVQYVHTIPKGECGHSGNAWVSVFN